MPAYFIGKSLRKSGKLPDKNPGSMMVHKLDLSPLVEALKAVVNPEDLVLLFGSAACNELGPDSDIDILIVSGVPHDELEHALSNVQGTLGRLVDATTYLPAEFRSALRRRDPLLRTILKGPTVRLNGTMPLKGDYASG